MYKALYVHGCSVTDDESIGTAPPLAPSAHRNVKGITAIDRGTAKSTCVCWQCAQIDHTFRKPQLVIHAVVEGYQFPGGNREQPMLSGFISPVDSSISLGVTGTSTSATRLGHCFLSLCPRSLAAALQPVDAETFQFSKLQIYVTRTTGRFPHKHRTFWAKK